MLRILKMLTIREEEEEEEGENYFDLLSDDEVVNIFNKLPYLDTLLRLSSVCYRFSSLVSKIDSITYTTFHLSASPSRSTFDTFHVRTIAQKFPEIKHLRAQIEINYFPNGADSTSFFGSHLDVLMQLRAESVKHSDSFTSDVKLVDLKTDLLRPEWGDSSTRMLHSMLGYSVARFAFVQDLIQELHNLRTLIMFNSSGSFAVLGEEQLGRLRNDSFNYFNSSGPIAVNVRAIHVPVLELKSCGVIMENVVLALFTNQKIELDSELKLLDGVDNPDNDWRFSADAIAEIVDKIRKNKGLNVKKIPDVIDFIK